MTCEEQNLTLLMARFLEMIAAFQAQTAQANNLLREHLHLENPMYWRRSGISQSGYCSAGKKIWYFYHGRGCKVRSKGLLIDWDYGIGGRTDGFDLWRLQIFAENSTKSFPEFRNEDALKAVFQEAINSKLIHQPFLREQDDLFYLSNVH